MKPVAQSITLQLSDKTIYEMIRFYDDSKQPSKNTYIRFFAKTTEVAISIYTTNKVLFQGDGANQEAAIWQAYESKQSSENSTKQTIHSQSKNEAQAKQSLSKSNTIRYPNLANHTAHAGSDEVGTGDYFGPVCVCACYVSSTNYDTISHLGIQDSKVMDDAKIREIAPHLQEILPYSLLILHNKKYNEIHDTYNMNGIKAMLHNQAYIHLRKKLGKLPDLSVVDQFTPPQSYYRYLSNEQEIVTSLHFETKAESKYLAVACASVIARHAFLTAMDQLSEQVDMPLPKGAGAKVDEAARELVKKHGTAMLNHVAKLHFANTKKIGVSHVE